MLPIAVGLIGVAILVTLGVRWWQARHPGGPAAPMMASAVVEQATPHGPDLTLEVRWQADGSTRHTTGSVSAAAFRAQGDIVWVCYSPKAPGDDKKTHLRLPEDPLCGQR